MRQVNDSVQNSIQWTCTKQPKIQQNLLPFWVGLVAGASLLVLALSML